MNTPSMGRLPRRRQRAFTLIEIAIAVAIVAILAAIAIPNYVEHVQRGRRSEAKVALVEAAHWQERFRTENNRYSCTLPTTTAGKYTLAVLAQDGTDCGTNPQDYLLTATPGTADDCGTFRLNNLGERSIAVGSGDPEKSGALFDRCWSR